MHSMPLCRIRDTEKAQIGEDARNPPGRLSLSMLINEGAFGAREPESIIDRGQRWEGKTCYRLFHHAHRSDRDATCSGISARGDVS
jgi:hypothetical protein